MRVKEILIKARFTLKEQNTFNDVVELFKNSDIEYIPVLDENEKLKGLITKKYLIKKFMEKINPMIKLKDLSLDRSLIIDENSNVENYINTEELYMAVKNSKGELAGIFSINNILKKGFENSLEKIKELKERITCIQECGASPLTCTELDDIIESSYDGIYITDGDANTLKINKSYENITGLKRSEMLNKNMYNLKKEGYISDSSTLKVLKDKKSYTIYQQFNTGKKALVSSNPIFDNSGKIRMVVTNVRDMTELYELEEKLIKNKEITEKYYSEIEAMRSQYLNSDEIIARDKSMLKVLEVGKRIANLDTTVLILGETGVGKEEIAKFIHKNSNRSTKNFIKINCGAIPQNLIESELFGYVKGAFTGANKEGKVGLFEAADRGTIFLDEVGELPLDVQVKLLRVLEEGEIERVGSVKTIKVDVRILAATNRNLEDMIKEKTFRSDLYYRLNVVPIIIPALRNRREDIIPLVHYYLCKLNETYKFTKTFSVDAMEALYNYEWPGNVRELKNIVERAMVTSYDQRISINDLPIKSSKKIIEDEFKCEENYNLKDAVERLEAKLINRASKNSNNVREAAKILGIDPSTFVRKRKKYLEKNLL